MTSTNGPRTLEEGVNHVNQLVLRISDELTQRAPGFLFTDTARDNSGPLPNRASIQTCDALFKATTDLWEEIALDHLREYYLTLYQFFAQYGRDHNMVLTENQFHRLFVISLTCGPDRAFNSFEQGDDLWDSGVPQDHDTRYAALMVFQTLPNLEILMIEDIIIDIKIINIY